MSDRLLIMREQACKTNAAHRKPTHMKRTIGRILASLTVLGVGGMVSWVIVTFSFDAMAMAGGSGPADITGPNLAKPVVFGVMAVLLVAAAWFEGRRRLTLLLLCFLFLTVSTHRLVEIPAEEVVDTWLLFPVQRLPSSQNGSDGPSCDVGPWLARCDDGGSGSFVTVTPIPFVSLNQGRGGQLTPKSSSS
jgi:hypothetical protein